MNKSEDENSREEPSRKVDLDVPYYVYTYTYTQDHHQYPALTEDQRAEAESHGNYYDKYYGMWIRNNWNGGFTGQAPPAPRVGPLTQHPPPPHLPPPPHQGMGLPHQMHPVHQRPPALMDSYDHSRPRYNEPPNNRY